MLLLESTDARSLREYLTDHMGAVKCEINTAIENAGEESTIIFITADLKDVVTEKDVIETLIISDEPDVLICRLINEGQINLVKKIRNAPRIIIVRAMGNLEDVIQGIYNDHGGSIGALMDILNSSNEKGTIIAVTDKPLHLNMKISDFYEKFLLINESFYPLFKSIRLHALKYLNIGIGNKDWYEVEIRIYDRYSAYKLHYQRLEAVFDSMDLGIILGESWTKDHPRLMMEVDVYRLRFFTFLDPKYIKKILLGLEYLEDGTRIVDYDVYYQRKKIDWSDTLTKEDPHTRHLLGLKYNRHIFTRLSEREAVSIKKIEEEILKTRY
jgi:hypothetical protein